MLIIGRRKEMLPIPFLFSLFSFLFLFFLSLFLSRFLFLLRLFLDDDELTKPIRTCPEQKKRKRTNWLNKPDISVNGPIRRRRRRKKNFLLGLRQVLFFPLCIFIFCLFVYNLHPIKIWMLTLDDKSRKMLKKETTKENRMIVSPSV